MLPKPCLFKTCITVVIAVWPTVGTASVLERVLRMVDVAFPESGSLSINANIAENTALRTSRIKTLGEGDRVIIGYDVNGSPVTQIAGASGLVVTPAQAASLTSGVSAGLFPAGSAIYVLPPAGQLSIYDQSSSGSSLSLAQEMVMARIDGSITNVLTSFTPGLSPDVTAFNSGKFSSSLDVSFIGSTTLGAVNAGEIVTNIKVVTGSNALGIDGMDLARLEKSPNVMFGQSLAGEISALSYRVNQLGGNFHEGMLALNVASNSSEITGRISNIVIGLNGSIGNTVATAIGAVNGGNISN